MGRDDKVVAGNAGSCFGVGYRPATDRRARLFVCRSFRLQRVGYAGDANTAHHGGIWREPPEVARTGQFEPGALGARGRRPSPHRDQLARTRRTRTQALNRRPSRACAWGERSYASTRRRNSATTPASAQAGGRPKARPISWLGDLDERHAPRARRRATPRHLAPVGHNDVVRD